MNENESKALPCAEVAAELPPSEAPEALAKPSEKKKRKGPKIAILIILLVLAFALVGSVSFFIGRNPDFDYSKLIPAFMKEKEPKTPPEFLGMWSGEGHTFNASANDIIELDGVKYTYTWAEDSITLKNSQNEEIRIGYKKTSNRIKLWKDEDKTDFIYVRRLIKTEENELYGSWVYGDTVISFSDMGTAEIYGNSYTYTVDGFEITCTSNKKTEYMFYTVNGDYLDLWQPGAPEKTLSFIRQGSLLPQLIGTWVLNNGSEYFVVSKDGSMNICDLTGVNSELYEDIVSASVDKDTVAIDYSSVSFVYSITVDGDYLRLDLAGKLIGEYYRVSKNTDLSPNDIEFLWSVYEPDEAV